MFKEYNEVKFEYFSKHKIGYTIMQKYLLFL